MKKIFSVVIAVFAVFVLVAEDPQLVFHFPAADGSGNVIKNSVAATASDAKISGTEFVWESALAGKKAIAFKNPVKSVTGKCTCGIAKINGKIDFSKPFTVMFWVYPDPTLPGNRQYTILSTAKTDFGPGWRIIYNYGSLMFVGGAGKVMPGLVASINNGKFPHRKGVWHHVTAVYDGTNVKLYLNGIEAIAKPMKLLNGHDRITIGAYASGYSYGFIGGISDIKIFAGALSAEQIIADAQGIAE